MGGAPLYAYGKRRRALNTIEWKTVSSCTLSYTRLSETSRSLEREIARFHAGERDALLRQEFDSNDASFIGSRGMGITNPPVCDCSCGTSKAAAHYLHAGGRSGKLTRYIRDRSRSN